MKYDNDRIYFFSPELLIVNGLKSKLEDSDFEIFNNDNFSVDIFSKFLISIIDEVNKSIKQNNFTNDFIKKTLIKFHKNDLVHYLSAKIDYYDKLDIKNDFLKINIVNEIANKNIDDIINDNNSCEDNNMLNGNLLSFSKPSLLDFEKRCSDYFEDLMGEKLMENIKKEKLILLPNIIFILNPKIPEYNSNNNTIEFKSLHFNFFNENKKFDNDNYYYVCKEIDGSFLNNSGKFTQVLDSKYFHTNLTFIKEKNESNFNLEENNLYKIYPKSIIFCEIKKTIPNLESGKKNAYKIELKELKKTKIKYIDNNNGYTKQLIKLIKKFTFFDNAFKDKINEKIQLENIHIVFVYDSYNIEDKG